MSPDFLVADNSMLAAYQESFEKYHIEDGNFTLEKKATDSQIKRLEKEGVQIYENYYVEEDADTDLDRGKRTVQSAFTKTAARSISYA